MTIDKINQFVAGILWKASITSQDMFKSVMLGCYYENILRDYIQHQHSFPSQIQYIFMKYDSSRQILQPLKRKVGGLNGYDFQFGEWRLLIKVDQRQLSGVLGEFADHTKEIWVIEEPFKGSTGHKKSGDIASRYKDVF